MDLGARRAALAAAVGVAVGAAALVHSWLREARARRRRSACSLLAAVGNTPLVELRSLSAATGRRVYAKCEFLNGLSGSVKDRPVVEMLADAQARGRLKPDQLLVEPTGGNTGLSLAAFAAQAGHPCVLTVPTGISADKVSLLRRLGAQVVECDSSHSIRDDGHYVNVAKRIAAERGGVMLHQFENLANARAHRRTGREIWEQTGGKVDAFVASAGTGGTISGVSVTLKARSPAVRIYVVDPPGSSVRGWVERGVWEAGEGKTSIDGIGIGRLTANMAAARIDAAFGCTDAEAVEMTRYLLRNEGLFVGPSAALNVCGAVKAARALPPGSTIVTVLCDGGERYAAKHSSDAWLYDNGLAPKATGKDVAFVL